LKEKQRRRFEDHSSLASIEDVDDFMGGFEKMTDEQKERFSRIRAPIDIQEYNEGKQA
jgi:hypothetical protein